MRKSFLVTAALVMAPMPVAAQMVDVPIWSNGILGQQALRSTYDNYDKAHGIDKGKGQSSSATSRQCSADALPAAERRAMEIEYKRRARADGKASADAWVHEQGRRFYAKLVASGACPPPNKAGKQVAATDRSSGKKPLLNKTGKPCSRTRLEQRVVASLGGGAMSMGMVTVCDD